MDTVDDESPPAATMTLATVAGMSKTQPGLQVVPLRVASLQNDHDTWHEIWQAR